MCSHLTLKKLVTCQAANLLLLFLTLNMHFLEAYSELCQTCKAEFFEKTFNGFQPYCSDYDVVAPNFQIAGYRRASAVILQISCSENFTKFLENNFKEALVLGKVQAHNDGIYYRYLTANLDIFAEMCILKHCKPQSQSTDCLLALFLNYFLIV